MVMPLSRAQRSSDMLNIGRRLLVTSRTFADHERSVARKKTCLKFTVTVNARRTMHVKHVHSMLLLPLERPRPPPRNQGQ